MKNLLIKTYLSVVMSLLISGQIFSTTYYVSTSGNNNNSGTSTDAAWRTIQHAASQAEAGDVTYIQAGTYSEDVSIYRSGNANAGYISFIGQGNVVMDGQNSLNIAFRNYEASFIHLENITIRDYIEEGIRFAPYNGPRIHHFQFKDLSIFNTGIAQQWSNNHGLQIQETDYFLVDGVYIYNSRGNNILINQCQHGAIINSEASGTGQRTDDDQDGILVQNSQHIRIANCIANGNPEDGIDIGGHGANGDIAHISVYECTTMNNNGEGLSFSATSSGEFSGYDVTFARCLSTGNAAGLTAYQNASDLRIVQNTFADNDNYGLNMNGPVSNAIVKNCIFAFQNENFSKGGLSESPNIIDIDHISWYPTGYPAWPYEPYYRGNNQLDQDPQFGDRNNDDYTLNDNSPCIDWGENLTATTSGGSGTQIPVGDAKYFSDGYYQAPGDMINVGTETVQVIDIQGNTITVDRSISWSVSAAVNFAYQGNAPDLGYKESEGSNPPPPTTACDLIDNGDFSDNLNNWSDWGCEMELQNGEALVDISNNSAGIKKGNGTLTFEQGKTYRITFDARAQSGRNMKVKATLDYSPYDLYFQEEVTLTTSMQSFEMTFTMGQSSAASALEFNFGGHMSNVFLDNVQVSEIDCGTSLPPPPPAECDLIDNGDFSANLNNWSDWGCEMELQNGEVFVDISSNSAGIKKGNGTLTFQQGKTYRITFDARAQSGRNMKVKATLDYSPYDLYFQEEVALTTSMQAYELTFTMEQYSSASSLEFNFYGNISNVFLDNVQVTELDCATRNDMDTETSFQATVFPNPFSKQTQLEYELFDDANVQINLYNTMGQLVNTPVSLQVQFAGKHSVYVGENISSGIYFYELKVDSVRKIIKIIKGN